MRSYLQKKIARVKWDESMIQVVECLPCKCVQNPAFKPQSHQKLKKRIIILVVYIYLQVYCRSIMSSLTLNAVHIF
jgi:hypothetical protein